MNSHINYEFCSFRSKISFIISLNSSYRTMKLARKNLDIYKPTLKENLLMLSLKTFKKREKRLLAMRHRKCTRKTGYLSNVRGLWL